MKFFDDTKLQDCNIEDICDVFPKLEKTFNCKFNDAAFKDAKTFGDVCDVVEANINYTHIDDCTKQQGFYRIRQAIAQTNQIDQKEVGLATNLVDLFPRHSRWKQTRKFQSTLGIKLNVLAIPTWIGIILGLGLLASLVMFFFNWKMALAGIAFIWVASSVASWLRKELKFETVRELVENAARENYIDLRRTKGTANRKEIVETIKDVFSDTLFIDKAHLTREAPIY